MQHNRRDFLKLGAAAAAVPLVGTSALEATGGLPITGGVDFSPWTGKERTAIPIALCPYLKIAQERPESNISSDLLAPLGISKLSISIAAESLVNLSVLTKIGRLGLPRALGCSKMAAP